MGTRPYAPAQPCPVCGSQVDPLRAGRVLATEAGFTYLCGAPCHRRFHAGERHRGHAPQTEGSQRVRRDPTTGRFRTSHVEALPPLSDPPRRELSHAPGLPAVALFWAAVAAGLGALSATPWSVGAASLSAAAAAASAATVIRNSTHLRQEVGYTAWLAAPVGVVAAATAGWFASLRGGDGLWFPLVGASFAAGLTALRAWLDARTRHHLAQQTQALARGLPSSVRVASPDPGDPTEVSFLQVPTERVQTGEEVLAVEGDTLAVDGIVQAGGGWALTHPAATTPVRLGHGDPMLAGARVVEGAVRVLTTHVGDDRGLLRAREFGPTSGRDVRGPWFDNLARLPRVADASAVALAAVAIAASVYTGTGSGLEVLACVLLAAPWLAARRAAEIPFAAAAGAAAARGIIFPGRAALESAGRTAAAAICTRGTVTVGAPEVVEVHMVDSSKMEPLLASITAAEANADDHPIARAVRTFARTRGVEPTTVRRATHLPGLGVTATTAAGESLVVGNRRLLLAEGVGVAVADAEATRAEKRGHSALFAALGGRVRAVLSLQDAIRPGARAAVQRIFDLAAEVILLSGDHRGSAEAMARDLDIANVRAELVPQERGAEIERLRESGGVVAVIGRIDRDDAALSSADVGFALGAAGGAVGDRIVALATDHLTDAAGALWIAKAARRSAWRSMGYALGVGGFVAGATAWVLPIPGLAACAGLLVDFLVLPAGLRLQRRIDLRVPARD